MFGNSPLNFLRSGADHSLFVAIVLALVAGITFHEFSHALVATLQGDQTARAQGRLTLNPLSHLDPLGSFALIVAGFGWGRPVPFSPGQLRSRRVGAALVGLAGPAANLVLAIVAALLLRFSINNSESFTFKLLDVLFQFNVILCVFNLLPIPPLDGSRLLSVLLPPNRQQIVYFLDQFGIFILLGIILLAPNLLGPVFRALAQLILRLVGFPGPTF